MGFHRLTFCLGLCHAKIKETMDHFNHCGCALFTPVEVIINRRGQTGDQVTWIHGTGARKPQARATRPPRPTNKLGIGPALPTQTNVRAPAGGIVGGHWAVTAAWPRTRAPQAVTCRSPRCSLQEAGPGVQVRLEESRQRSRPRRAGSAAADPERKRGRT
jgi:hypothetical protein